MKILWDERKRLVNLDKHGLDFAALDEGLFAQAAIGPAKDGRLIAVGELNGVVTVVFVTLGAEALSVISMRPASNRERRGV
ncbi:BrnT family toxin [Bosea sp. PAMC 26642]|uniref:BrnT family toxin n=1 Tax=Bosea sp. (strain PAMC 26642) TaxID=1792307 RepID=UPI0007704E4D|nr:BrnT family toxin [Bosea sp. PAMC 26642]AMJ63602.1 hypothetical protein AXW83_10365 [Bosea sp. PAMC 26642]